MDFWYNDPLTAAIVSTNILSFVMMVIFLLLNISENDRHNALTKAFNLFVFFAIIGIIIDTVIYIVQPTKSNQNILFYLMVVDYASYFALTGAIFNYLRKFYTDIAARLSKCLTVLMTLALAFSVFCFALGLLKYFFYYEDGVYHEGVYTSLYSWLGCVLLVVELITIVIARKEQSLRYFLYAFVSIIIPSMTLILEMFLPEFYFGYSFLAINTVFIFATFQKNTINSLQKEKLRAEYKALTDPLTGVKNRRAYQELTDDFKAGVHALIYCDVNGLKFTNDLLGHDAGDKLILEFAFILTAVFRSEEVYRLGGDEFVVLLPGIKKEAFNKRIESLKSKINSVSNPIASVGAVYDKKLDFSQLQSSAEAKMYLEKEEFYRRSHIQRR